MFARGQAVSLSHAVEFIEGSFRAHQVPLTKAGKDEAEFKVLKEWLQSYRIGELWDDEKEWWKEVLRLTEGRGVDVVFDSVGLVNESLKCLAHKGRILIIGFAARDDKSLESVMMNRVLLKQAMLIGYA